jgi:fructokinase
MNIKDEDLHTYVHIAGIAASINCERAGAEPPTKSDLEDALTLEI